MSVKQTYIDRINENINNANSLNVDNFIQEAKNKNAAKRQEDIDKFSSGVDSQINNTRNYYDKQTQDAKVEYEKSYERNAVQKMINEKTVAERNENLGLTDSGLNRTQQTAVQLSYANQRGNIDIARQNTLDELNLKLTDAITNLENEKRNGITQIENNWDTYSTQQGTNLYNSKLSYYNDLIKSDSESLSRIEQAEMEAQTELYKKQMELNARLQEMAYNEQKAQSYILRTDGGLLSREYNGSLRDNGINTIYNYDSNRKPVSVTYVDNNSGKKTTIDYGKNPYTGEDNLRGNSDAAKAARSYGTYDNGYQPKGVYKDGVDYGQMVRVTDKTDPNKTFGMAFNVFVTGKEGNEHNWVWDGSINNYIEVYQENGVWKWKGLFNGKEWEENTPGK